ncbi:MAG: 16S rRNA (uracil(1498)-N(3))-methyltransferase [Ruminococcaceae bacterium]|nr:16S rRNA (uracil(1498)-N(3))-methyltransferase [Oscillospiraceae bacterium]
MAWFFTDEEINGTCIITGEDAKHIEKSLRMRVGEELTLVTPSLQEHLCRISAFYSDSARVESISSKPCENEADVKVTLYQSLTKGDKMDLIVQKSVELGVERIVPVVTSRCVSRPDEKSIKKKIERWQKIALGAAQQSCRGIVPLVDDVMSFEEALGDASQKDVSIIFYEGGGESLKTFTDNEHKSFGIFVGCEGGFDVSEVEKAKESGVLPATLGKRILRAETAPLAAISAIMCLTGNFD